MPGQRLFFLHSCDSKPTSLLRYSTSAPLTSGSGQAAVKP